MKGIVSLKRDKESFERLKKHNPNVSEYHEVGMTHVTLVEGKSIVSLCNKANQFAKSEPYRLEIWYGDNIYKEPNKTLYRGG